VRDRTGAAPPGSSGLFEAAGRGSKIETAKIRRRVLRKKIRFTSAFNLCSPVLICLLLSAGGSGG
jgi:hypothetical protein